MFDPEKYVAVIHTARTVTSITSKKNVEARMEADPRFTERYQVFKLVPASFTEETVTVTKKVIV